MKTAALAWRMLVHPADAWNEVAERDDRARDTVLRYVLPLALLPAAGWALRMEALAPASRLASFAATFVLVTFMVFVVATAFQLLAPAYAVPRRWSAAVAVAAFGSTPMMACGLLFVSPLLAAIGVVALMQALYLYSLGLRRIMGCRAGDAAEFTAMAFLVSTALSGAAGAAGSALGWL